MGFSEGIVLGYRITEAFGIIGGAGFNHTGDTTQFLGTIGFQRFGNPNGSDAIDRTSVWVLWDQFSDFDADSYIHQFRFQTGYVLSKSREVGMLYSVPTSSQSGGGQIPLGGAGSVNMGDSYVGPYYSTPFRNSQVFSTIGYSDEGNDVGGGMGIAVPFSSGVSNDSKFFVNSKYGGDDEYAMSVGMAFGFGRADTTEW